MYMRITLTPQELAKQLPELRLDILQIYDGPIVLAGKEVDLKRPKEDEAVRLEERYPILKTHPHFEKIFTHKELLLLSS